MSKKKLKLGFAMGGGVSLGTFSGAALSEAIKQAVLSDEYSDIEIDIFAGASAGSMSLAIMLRGLAYQTKEEYNHAVKTLQKEIPGFDTMPEPKKGNLIAAQVVQDIQYNIWVKEINIFGLLGVDKKHGTQIEDLTYEAGLVRRNALIDIARKYFRFEFEKEGQANFKNRRMLGDRVLFASTLTNLTPLKIDSRTETQKTDPSYLASHDAFTSYTHREMRVFDFNFGALSAEDVKEDDKTYPKKWIRYHLGEKTPGVFGNLTETGAWSKIVATSIACGAFPFAFEPVVLRRHDYEFGGDWPKEELKDVATPSASGQSSWYPFTYVDGGTMNNEPVREAFRMAAFKDAGETDDFERVVIFVDPNVGDGKVDYRVPIHKRYFVQDPFAKWASALDGFDLERSPTMNRLAAQLGTMLGVLTRQVRNNEHDKINDTLQLFQDRKRYCEPLFRMIDKLDDPELTQELKNIAAEVKRILDNEAVNELLPPGAITPEEELIRIRRENLDHLELLTIADIRQFCTGDLAGFSVTTKKLLLKAHHALLVSILVGLAGKSVQNRLVAIGPVIRHDGGIDEPIFLPGGYLAAFAGFFSEIPNEYEAALAKFCARASMINEHLIPKNSPGEVPFPGKFGEKSNKDERYNDVAQQKYEAEFRANLKFAKQRIDNICSSAKILNIPLAEGFAFNRIAGFINRKLEEFDLRENPEDKFLFFIPVKDSDLEVDGVPHNSDIQARPETLAGKKGYYIITELTYRYNDGIWIGAHVQHSQSLLIQEQGVIDSNICYIPLPDKKLVQTAKLYPNPIFTIDREISKKDKKTSPKVVWRIDHGISPLEDSLFT